MLTFAFHQKNLVMKAITTKGSTALFYHKPKGVPGDSKVSFMYKDYADGCKEKQMTLEATEFLRRFCLHILPPGFRNIRYYGFMANVNSALLRVQQKEMGIITTRANNRFHLTVDTLAIG